MKFDSCGALPILIIALLASAVCAQAPIKTTVVSLSPTSDAGNTNSVGYLNNSELYSDLADGVSFSQNDGDVSYVRSGGGVALSSYTAGYSGAPAGLVTQVTANYVARRVASSGTIQIKLYNGAILIGTGPIHPLGATYGNFSDTFSALNVTSANNLRTEIDFDNTSNPVAESLRCTQIWISATINAPFVMFSTSGDPAVYSVLNADLAPTDYVSSALFEADNSLQGTIPSAHVYSLPTSYIPYNGNEDVQGDVTTSCESSNHVPGLVLFDIEHWTETPPSENGSNADAEAAIDNGATYVASNPCNKPSLSPSFGTTPDGQFMGLAAGSCSPNPGSGIYMGVNWEIVAFVNIQAQRAVDDASCPNNGSAYENWVDTLATYIRLQNPQIIITAQFSFLDSDLATIENTVELVKGKVDGVYIAYPSNPGPCPNCTPNDLDALIKYVKSETLSH